MVYHTDVKFNQHASQEIEIFVIDSCYIQLYHHEKPYHTCSYVLINVMSPNEEL